VAVKTCPYCGVGCGVVADTDSAGAVTVRGDPLHPANFGRLCAKGSALAETIDCRIVVIDPRRTATCEGADLHLPLRSGSDAVLFSGLLAHLAT
jgi:anaerobic selenocysteine-containing dehydrogenase